MPVPIVLMAGFLGAGKTTVVNHILAHASGRRIAAVINDFGAINTDAELIAGILRHNPRPDSILIETSGVADPADIVRTLMDPVIWKEAPLETALCVVDATTPMAKLDDDLGRSQLGAADVVVLSKTDLVEAIGGERIRDAVKAIRPMAVVVDAPHGRVPAALPFPEDLDRAPVPRESRPRHRTSDRFETLSWTSDRLVSLARKRRSGSLRRNLPAPRGCSRR